MAKSILQREKECYITHSTLNLDEHHVMNGPFRKKSEKYGLKIYLRKDCHIQTPYAAHNNLLISTNFKKIAQITFESLYGHDLWLKEFKKNYIDSEDHIENLIKEIRNEVMKYV